MAPRPGKACWRGLRIPLTSDWLALARSSDAVATRMFNHDQAVTVLTVAELLFRTRANGHSGSYPRVAVTDGAVGLEHALSQLAGWLSLVHEISVHAGSSR